MPQNVMTGPSKVVPAWLLGVLVAGSLDLADALLVHGVRGVPPVRVLQSIAGGFLGRGTFSGGATTAGIGLLTHYAIIAVMMTVYVGIQARAPWCRRHVMVAGLLYGSVLYAFMTHVILPVSAASQFLRPPAGIDVLNAWFAHAVLVGVPIAVFARRMPMPRVRALQS